MQHPNKHTCNIRQKKTDETLRTGACNICVQPLQHVQHHDLFLQHPYQTDVPRVLVVPRERGKALVLDAGVPGIPRERGKAHGKVVEEERPL